MYKILSLDGGGIGGLYTASLLASWEQTCGIRIADYFDLIVGTSTGGIIALGIGSGMPCEQIVDFYKNRGPDIFKTSLMRKFNQVFRSKYDSEGLRKSLVEAMGDKLLGECKTRIVIPAVDLEYMKPRVYKTAHHERFMHDYRKPIVDIALATSAAPTYFPSRTNEGIAYVDGAVWANNPSAVAAVEAIGVLGWKPGEYKIVSIGCPSKKRSFGNLRNKGLAFWGLAQTNMFMQASSEYALNVAKLLSGNQPDASTVYRIGRVLDQNADIKLDNVKTRYLNKLEAWGRRDAESELPEIRKVFFQNERHPIDFVYNL